MQNRQDLQKELNGHQYKIGLMTPHKAAYWAYKLIGNGFNAASLIDFKPEEFKGACDDALSMVKYNLDNQWFHLDPDNLPAHLEGPDYLVVATTAFTHSLEPFFDPARLKELTGAILPLLAKLGLVTLSTDPSTQDSGNSTNSGTEPTP